MQVFRRFAPIQPGNVGEELDLRRRPVAVGPVNLAVEMACVNEEDGVLSGRAGLGTGVRVPDMGAI